MNNDWLAKTHTVEMEQAYTQRDKLRIERQTKRLEKEAAGEQKTFTETPLKVETQQQKQTCTWKVLSGNKHSQLKRN